MKSLIYTSILFFTGVSSATELACTIYSASRGGTKTLGIVNTSNVEQSKFILKTSGILVSSAESDKLTNEDKLSSLTISFSNRNNNPNEPFAVVGQFEKVDGMDILFNKPLLSSSGTSAGLNINYLDKDIAINCAK